jgi:hypothetical protein
MELVQFINDPNTLDIEPIRQAHDRPWTLNQRLLLERLERLKLLELFRRRRLS